METTPVISDAKKTQAGSLSNSSLTPCRRPGLSRPSSSSLSRTSAVCTPNPNVGAAVVNECKSSQSSSSADGTPKLSCEERLKVTLKIIDAQIKQSAIRKVRRRLSVVSKTPEKGESGDFSESASVSIENDGRICKKSKLSLEQLNVDNEVGECSSLDRPSSPIHKVDSKLSEISTENIDASDGSDEKVTAGVSEISTENIDAADGSDEEVTAGVSEISTENIDTADDSDEEVTAGDIEKLMKSIQDKKKKLDQLKVQAIYAKKHNLEELRAQTANWKRAGLEALEYSVSLAKDAGYSVTTKQLLSQHSFPKHLMGYNSEDDEFQ